MFLISPNCDDSSAQTFQPVSSLVIRGTPSTNATAAELKTMKRTRTLMTKRTDRLRRWPGATTKSFEIKVVYFQTTPRLKSKLKDIKTNLGPSSRVDENLGLQKERSSVGPKNHRTIGERISRERCKRVNNFSDCNRLPDRSRKVVVLNRCFSFHVLSGLETGSGIQGSMRMGIFLTWGSSTRVVMHTHPASAS
jgi:hypothetical protein